MLRTALEARDRAYAPYSRYAVGAALLCVSGALYSGCNIENAAYPVTICAERVAVFKAVSEGQREHLAIAVATEDGGSPCGSCRQALAEFGLDTIVILADGQGNVLLETDVRELLPNAFTPANLQKKG